MFLTCRLTWRVSPCFRDCIFFCILAKDLMESISSLRWLFVRIRSLLMTTSKVCVLSFNFQIQQYEKEIRELKSQLDNCTYEVKYFILM